MIDLSLKFNKTHPIVIFFVFLILILSNTTTANFCIDNSENLVIKPQKINKKELIPIENKIVHIHANSFYDYGYKVGELILFNKTLNLFFRALVNHINKKNRTENLEIHKYAPFYNEMLNGFSDRLKITLNQALLLQDQISKSLNSEACTITLSTGPATKNNETFLSQNFDNDPLSSLIWFIGLSRIFYIAHIENYYSYSFIGIPIFLECRILNEKGLGWGGNWICLNKTRPVDTGKGMFIYELELRTMLGCSTVDEVEDLYRNTNRSSGRNTFPDFGPRQSDNAANGYCDSNGGILVMEQMHSYFIAQNETSTNVPGLEKLQLSNKLYHPPGILWHTNHHMWLDPMLTGSVLPKGYSSSELRANRCKELLENNYGDIDLKVIKNITKDHGKGFIANQPDSGDICRHSDKYGNGTTMFAWIVEPKKLTIHMTNGRPCCFPYKSYDFTDDFEEGESQISISQNLMKGKFLYETTLINSLLKNQVLPNNDFF